MSYIMGNPLAAACWLLGIVLLLRWFNVIASDPSRRTGDSELGLVDEEKRLAERTQRSPRMLSST